MIRQKKYNIFNKDNEQYKFERIQLVEKSQLNTYLFKMISFGVDNIIMNDIISYYKNYYFLKQNIADSLYNIIEKGKVETISDICTKNETIISFDNENNDKMK